jgi:hypothetical protein
LTNIELCGKGTYKTNSAAAYGGIVLRIMADRWTLQFNKDTKPWQGLHSTYSQHFGFIRNWGGGGENMKCRKIDTEFEKHII